MLMSREVEEVFRSERQRALATLIRLLGGDFDLAEDMLQEAFVEAVARWPVAGVPSNPRAWLVSTGRFKGLDRLRRRAPIQAWGSSPIQPF
jgi:RNA polymerase sigma-70 factor, ECF subfamily